MAESAAETTRKREQLKELYPGPKWAKRVNLMSPQQVIAIHFKFQNLGKIK